MTKRMYSDLAGLLEVYTIPVTTLAILFGGVVWLTSLHNLTEKNKEDIQALNEDFDRFKSKVYLRLNSLDERLARMEGKIDFLIKSRTQP